MAQQAAEKAYFHLPGLFEFYSFYEAFLPVWQEHREYFHDWCDIGSIYGAPADCTWGGGRVENGAAKPAEVLALLKTYGISGRLTFSNSLLKNAHLRNKACNELCRLFSESSRERSAKKSVAVADSDGAPESGSAKVAGTGEQSEPLTVPAPASVDGAVAGHEAGDGRIRNGVIVHSDLLLKYIKEHYPDLYVVSSTTKVLTEFADLKKELEREEFRYVVPDFRLNKHFDELSQLPQEEKDKVEFLCNECCSFYCKDRKACYESVSRKNLGIDGPEHHCRARGSNTGYRFSTAMANPGFISADHIHRVYMPMGFSNFKIEGRSLGSALLLEFVLYYMTKPEYQIHVREALYLDNMLDLF
ncbi:MAG: hypothetical protein Q4B73_04675 [Lachnospiraceae bacterium]|nr:hypothetical protein [Lachnospiraceae bacterium]